MKALFVLAVLGAWFGIAMAAAQVIGPALRKRDLREDDKP